MQRFCDILIVITRLDTKFQKLSAYQGQGKVLRKLYMTSDFKAVGNTPTLHMTRKGNALKMMCYLQSETIALQANGIKALEFKAKQSLVS